MGKRIFVVLIGAFLVAVSFNIAMASIHYKIEGAEKRALTVYNYMMDCGYDVSIVSSQEIMGEFNGKPWPGVRIYQEGSNPGEGIWVPVSDIAITKGLCLDQRNLIDALPRQPLTLSNCSDCWEGLHKRSGFWVSVPDGEVVEVKANPKGLKVVYKNVNGFRVEPIECYYTKTFPDASSLSQRWGGNWKLRFQWEQPGGDGGWIKTFQIWVRCDS